jgi:hypothetical protein
MVEFAKNTQAKHGLWVDQFGVHDAFDVLMGTSGVVTGRVRGAVTDGDISSAKSARLNQLEAL